jgi:hypothetical protein
MPYNDVWSKVCELKSNQIAIAVVKAASGGMNNGQLAILEGSGKVSTYASVDTDRDRIPYFPDHYTSTLNYSHTEFTADYDEPFGDLFGKANETAERYAEIAFNNDFYALTEDGAVDDLLENFREAEKYVDTVIGVFI